MLYATSGDAGLMHTISWRGAERPVSLDAIPAVAKMTRVLEHSWHTEAYAPACESQHPAEHNSEFFRRLFPDRAGQIWPMHTSWRRFTAQARRLSSTSPPDADKHVYARLNHYDDYDSRPRMITVQPSAGPTHLVNISRM